MAIQFARIEIVTRSKGGNACCKGAYNARSLVKDHKTNLTYNFQDRGDNVYHEILLPLHADPKYKNLSSIMNEVERMERRKNSQLLKDIVLALPDEAELTLQDRITITKRLIEQMNWVNEGLAVQLDIHQPHDGKKNWHAHLLVTTRRFSVDGLVLEAKARDLNPEFKSNSKARGFIIPEEKIIHENLREIINVYFQEIGLEKRVDAISAIPHEHIGPMRMRSLLNTGILRNQERQAANIELLNSSDELLSRVTKSKSIFTVEDFKHHAKCIPSLTKANQLIKATLEHPALIPLQYADGSQSEFYTTKEIRRQELKLMRLAKNIHQQQNLTQTTQINHLLTQATTLVQQQQQALTHLCLAEGGLRVLKGRAGTGKSKVLKALAKIGAEAQINLIGLAPTHKAKQELSRANFTNCDTLKGFLFKFYQNKITLPKHSVIVLDEAGMVANADYVELFRVASRKQCNVILAGDERQLSSIDRGGMFAYLAETFGFVELTDIQRQKIAWGREVAMALANGDASTGITTLETQHRLINHPDLSHSMQALLTSWDQSKFALANRLIITIKNTDVTLLNQAARELLKAKHLLTGPEYRLTLNKHADALLLMQGERIVFTATEKKLGISNGSFAEIKSINTNSCTVKLDDHTEVTFDPTQFPHFKHGYATTIYKAQGASIHDVYVLHNGISNDKNSYVALSRHVHDVHLFTNTQATKNQQQLRQQLSANFEYGVSLNYLTHAELTPQLAPTNLFGKLQDFAKQQLTKFTDKHCADLTYYDFVKPEKVTAALEKVYATAPQNSSAAFAKINPMASEFLTSINPLSTQIASALLGKPNQYLSTRDLACYGEEGEVALVTQGKNSGQWYDFKQQQGGDLLNLVTTHLECDPQTAFAYLSVFKPQQTNLAVVTEQEFNQHYVTKQATINLTQHTPAYTEQQIYQQLTTFAEQKMTTLDLATLMPTILAEQQFLASLSPKLPGLDPELANYIQAAHTLTQNQGIVHFQESLTYACQHKLVDPQQLVTKLQETHNYASLQQTLHTHCAEHHYQQVQRNLSHIIFDKALTLDPEHHFTSCADYLKHEIAEPKYNFTKVAQLKAQLAIVAPKLEPPLMPEIEHGVSK